MSKQLFHAIILCGGEGSRLRPYTDTLPKTLVPILNKPILRYQLEWLTAYGITHVTLATGRLHHCIEEYIPSCQDLNLQISFHQEDLPRGTAGCLYGLPITETTLVVYGDLLINMDIQRFANHHFKHQSDATLLVHPNDHPHDSDLVTLNKQHRITQFHPKPHPSLTRYQNLVSAAMYIIEPQISSFIPEKGDFIRDVFMPLVQSHTITGYSSPEYVKDVGTLQRLQEVATDITSGRFDQQTLQKSQKAIFLDRDGTLCIDQNNRTMPDTLELLPHVAKAIKQINRSSFLAILVTNQPGVAKGFITDNDVQLTHQELETALAKEGAYLDHIYYCPHHPEKGFSGEIPELKINCNCRKPNIGMFKQAENDFNIDLSQSYMIGDTLRDIDASKNAKMTGLLVNSTDTKAAPDKQFESVVEGIQWILEKRDCLNSK